MVPHRSRLDMHIKKLPSNDVKWSHVAGPPAKKVKPVLDPIFEDQINISKSSSNRILWIDELEQRFTTVVERLGAKCVPSEIRYHMNVSGISCKQVASHLQKFRNKQKTTYSPQSPENLLMDELENQPFERNVANLINNLENSFLYAADLSPPHHTTFLLHNFQPDNGMSSSVCGSITSYNYSASLFCSIEEQRLWF